MAKTKKETITEVIIQYDLFDLPTAQHKAGLAGLALAIRSLKNRSDNDPAAVPPESVPEITDGPTANAMAVRFTQLSFSNLMNDVYDADPTRIVHEQPRKNKKTKENIPWLDRAPIDVFDKKTDKTTTKDGYVYLDAIPRLNPIRFSLGEQAPWLKIWCDFLKSVVRDSKKWAPYQVRAAAKSPEAARYMASPADQESDEITEAPSNSKRAKGDGSSWFDLVAFEVERARGQAKLGGLSSALMLGAQDCNAESVDFKGRVEHNILLHFWPLCSFITVPWLIDREGKSKEVGFVVAIPEVADLKRFCITYPKLLANLKPNLRGKFRPAQAVIDLPAQGALEFINAVAQIKTAEQDDNPIRAVTSVDFLHLDKQGKNVKLLTSGRVACDERLLARYRDIVGTTDRPGEYRNPLFKAVMIQALLRDKPWWGELLRLFMTRDWRFFVQARDTPSEAPDIGRLPWFWLDVCRKFKECAQSLMNLEELKKAMRPDDAENLSAKSAERMPDIIRRIVAKYVLSKAKERTKDQPEKMNDEKERIAQSLFLEFRSRKDQAFVDHFANTFFSVGQWYDSKLLEFEMLSAYMLDRTAECRDDLKTLTLAALSAVSWVPQEKSSKGETE